MVDPDGDAAPAGLIYELGRLLDGLGAIVLGAPLARGAPGDVDRCSARAELDRYPASGSARPPSHQSHFVFQP